MLGIADRNKELRRELRGREQAAKVQFPEALSAWQAVDKGAVSVAAPAEDVLFPAVDDDFSDSGEQAGPVLGRQGTERVIVQPFSVARADPRAKYTAMKPHVQKKEQKTKRAPTRCRECGHAVKDPNWAQYHREPSEFKGGKRTRKCTVKESERKEGFPLAASKRMSSMPH